MLSGLKLTKGMNVNTYSSQVVLRVTRGLLRVSLILALIGVEQSLAGNLDSIIGYRSHPICGISPDPRTQGGFSINACRHPFVGPRNFGIGPRSDLEKVLFALWNTGLLSYSVDLFTAAPPDCITNLGGWAKSTVWMREREERSELDPKTRECIDRSVPQAFSYYPQQPEVAASLRLYNLLDSIELSDPPDPRLSRLLAVLSTGPAGLTLGELLEAAELESLTERRRSCIERTRYWDGRPLSMMGSLEDCERGEITIQPAPKAWFPTTGNFTYTKLARAIYMDGGAIRVSIPQQARQAGPVTVSAGYCQADSAGNAVPISGQSGFGQGNIGIGGSPTQDGVIEINAVGWIPYQDIQELNAAWICVLAKVGFEYFEFAGHDVTARNKGCVVCD